MTDLSLEQAQTLAQRAVALAQTQYNNRPICVAVCDSRGLLLAFARMDGGPARSVAIAQGKAYTSARIGTTTAAFHERLQREKLDASAFCDAALTAMPGATPVKSGAGVLMGAVGVSGLATAEDQAITDAVAAAV